MANITITQYPRKKGVLLKVEIDEPSAIIAYVRDADNQNIYDLKEVLDVQAEHYVPLYIPSTYVNAKIVVQALK